MGNLFSRRKRLRRTEALNPEVQENPVQELTDHDIPDQQSPTGGNTAATYIMESQNFSAGPVLPGTLAYDILKLRISEARKTFVSSKTFEHVTRKLVQLGYVTICGASGEGKTNMALMLTRKYLKKGYEAVFVANVDMFEISETICSTDRLILIIDDIFGTVGITTNISHLRNLLNCLHSLIQVRKHESTNSHNTQRSGNRAHQANHERQVERAEQNKKRDIRVVFTSKTYNFNDGLLKLQYQKLSMFTGNTVVDITKTNDNRYTNEEKIAMFDKHKIANPSVKTNDLSQEDLLNLDTTLFGFPLTCKLFFEFAAFGGHARDFFQRPLFYLRIELNTILDLNNAQTAALILMLLCQDNLDLAKLEIPGRDQTMEERVKRVSDLLPSVARQGIVTAVKNFRGTFFTGGDVLTFSHSSIYDACACAWYKFNPGFVLQYCSLDFLYERLKPGHVEEARATDHLHFLFVSERYYDLVSTRLVEAMKQGQFAKTVAHPLSRNHDFVEVLVKKLKSALVQEQDNNWICRKDRNKGILYWVVQGHSAELIHELENLLKISFTQNEIIEALEGCVQTDKLKVLQFLLCKLEKGNDPATLNKLLWLSGETSSWKVAEYLLKSGADIYASDTNMQNYIHITCQSERPDIIKCLIRQIGSVVLQKNYLSALNSLDINGRTPAMLAAWCGSWVCFTLISSDSDLDRQDIDGDMSIHWAARHGNKDIVQRVLTPSHINSRGQYNWTPVMNAAAYGQQSNFDFLLSMSADLTLVDVYGDSLLHLACLGGNKHIIQHVLSPSNINSRGRHGWTPVMVAAVHGQHSAFDILSSKSADLTLLDVYGDSLLHLACRGGNIDIVQCVLSPSNINSRGQYGETPIMKAAAHGKQTVFNYLISNNADLTLVSSIGDTLLHLACQGGKKDIVKVVLPPSNSNGKGQYGETLVVKAAVHGQQTVFDYLISNNADLIMVEEDGESLLHLACEGGNRGIVQRLLTHSNINSRGLHGWTPIMRAAVHGQKCVFEFLSSKSADLTLVSKNGDSLLHLACQGGNRDIVQSILTPSNVNKRGMNSWTPVMYAAVHGQQSVFELLASNNADLNLVDISGDSLLHLASQRGNIDIVQHVLTPSNINSRGFNGWTPVMTAAVHGQQSVFDFLSSKSPDLTLVDDYGDSVLHLACQGGNRDIVQGVMTPSNINKRGMNRWTPVMYAAVHGQQSMFELLASNNAVLTLVDEEGDSLLHLACQGGSINVVQQVLTPSNINSRGRHGWTPVMIAAVSRKKSVFDFLFSKSADLSLVDDHGDSLLHLACQGGNKDIVQCVLSSSNINKRGIHGWTPVMVAAAAGQQSVFDFLSSMSADLTLMTNNGDSLLHLAIQGGNRYIVQCVLTPSNINSRGFNGWTPVMTAAHYGHGRIIYLLVEKQADLTPTDVDGDDVVHIAKKEGRADVAEYLKSILDENSK